MKWIIGCGWKDEQSATSRFFGGEISKEQSITKKSDMIEQERGSGGEHRR